MNREFLYLVNCCASARGLPVFPAASQHSVFSPTAKNPLPLDEDLLLRKALQHKTISTLYAGLAGAATGLSQAGMKKLKQLAVFEQAARSFILQEWQGIDEACKRHGIPVMTIKGPAASAQLYGDALVREYTDLDMVVSMQDINGIIPIMKEIGYTIAPPHKQPAKPLRLRQYSRFIQMPAPPVPPNHLVFSRKNSPLRVEIHNKVFELFKDCSSSAVMSLEQVFARSATIVQNGYGFATPCLADHAVFMLLHGAKHRWCLLHWLLDAAALLHKGDSALHLEMAAKIRSLGCERKLALSVQIIRKLFPIAVPEPFQSLIAPHRQSMALPARIVTTGLQQAEHGTTRSTVVGILSFLCGYQLPLAQGWQEKMNVLLPYLRMNQADAEALPLPEFLHPLYLLVRPFFIIFRRINRALARRKKAWLPQN